jgi:acyl-CoA reductase-like NAD-dependent aldehyde dehydrogenase
MGMFWGFLAEETFGPMLPVMRVRTWNHRLTFTPLAVAQ